MKKMNDYEIREYPAHIVAQTTAKGSYGSLSAETLILALNQTSLQKNARAWGFWWIIFF
jgi:hypothetical protein